jgi:formylglycine-generating enzyme required for sulfatase activity
MIMPSGIEGEPPMDTEFIAILQKLVAEQGKETLLNTAKCKAFLSDYTRGEYKKESRVFLLALEARVQKALETAENITICKKQQIRLLHIEYSLDEKVAVDVVDTLALVLRGDTSKTVIQKEKPQPVSAPQLPVQTKTLVYPQHPVPDSFVRINGGTFIMGSPAYEPEHFDNEGPQHQVTVSSFYMEKYQVTQAEYQVVMGTNPSEFKGSNLPVEQVDWYDAVEFCNRLSQREGITPAYSGSGDNITCNWNANGYRLPTEAEWEYACRAGTTTPFNTGDNITTDQANYDGRNPYNKNATGIYRGTTTAVGSFASNHWGLYDMHGNVWEWCWDWSASYSCEAQTNPDGAVLSAYRVLRGGSWDDDGQYLRSAFRLNYASPSSRYNILGFRLVRS